jgi:hypothetical protein
MKNSQVYFSFGLKIVKIIYTRGGVGADLYFQSFPAISPFVFFLKWAFGGGKTPI